MRHRFRKEKIHNTNDDDVVNVYKQKNKQIICV